ncbi:MAG: hypothetical protein LBC56_02185 [Oscillospiraceae bacterium]|jgi:hypothetical protein|nr:hypothetical protein [Oscillospiraceae bacterium]
MKKIFLLFLIMIFVLSSCGKTSSPVETESIAEAENSVETESATEIESAVEVESTTETESADETTLAAAEVLSVERDEETRWIHARILFNGFSMGTDKKSAPIVLEVDLPESWNPKVASEDEIHPFRGAVGIFDVWGCIGAFGGAAIIYTDENGNLPTPKTAYPSLIYNDLFMSSWYSWSDNYTVIQKTETKSTATVDVYSTILGDGGGIGKKPSRIHWGILSSDLDLMQYVYIEIDRSAITIREHLEIIAKSVKLEAYQG